MQRPIPTPSEHAADLRGPPRTLANARHTRAENESNRVPPPDPHSKQEPFATHSGGRKKSGPRLFIRNEAHCSPWQRRCQPLRANRSEGWTKGVKEAPENRKQYGTHTRRFSCLLARPMRARSSAAPNEAARLPGPESRSDAKRQNSQSPAGKTQRSYPQLAREEPSAEQLKRGEAMAKPPRLAITQATTGNRSTANIRHT